MRRTILSVSVILALVFLTTMSLAAQPRTAKVPPVGQFKVFKYSVPAHTIPWIPDEQERQWLRFELVPNSADSVIVGASIKMDVKGAWWVGFHFPTGYANPDEITGAWNVHQTLDWLHFENHTLGRPIYDFETDGTTSWGAGRGFFPAAGFDRYPVALRFCPINLPGDECAQVEIRDLEMDIYYLDNAVER